jgi:hypothetical protein
MISILGKINSIVYTKNSLSDVATITAELNQVRCIWVEATTAVVWFVGAKQGYPSSISYAASSTKGMGRINLLKTGSFSGARHCHARSENENLR